MTFIREDMADIHVSVQDAAGTWATFSPAGGGSWYSVEGGNLEADDSKVRPGGMGNEVSLGGPASREDVTVTLPLDDVVIGWHKVLEQRVREDAPTRVGYTFLNRLGGPVGASHSVTGTLKSAFLPDMDTGSSDAAMYSIIVSCDEVAP